MAGHKLNSKTKSKEYRTKSNKNVSSANEEREDVDYTVLRKPILTSITGFAQARKVFDLATEELKNLLTNECDILYECKVCRNIFRSLANFISHKRIYCKECFDKTVHGHFVRTLSDANEISRINQIEEMYNEAKRKDEDLEVLNEECYDDRIPLTKDLTEVLERLTTSRGKQTQQQKNPDVVLQEIPKTNVAVFQTIMDDSNTATDLMQTQIKELDMIMSRENAVLHNDGTLEVQSSLPPMKAKEAESVIQISDDENIGDSDILKCKICDLQFSTQKTLKFHMKYKHLESRLVYPCPDCLEIFSTSWSVYRHLFKVHRKTAAQIRRMRESIQTKAFRMNNPPAYYQKRKNAKNITPQKITEEERLDQENQAWMDNLEGDCEVPRCGGCGRTFERRAALAAHTHTCQPRSRALARRPPDPRKIEIQIRKDYNKAPPPTLTLPMNKAESKEKPVSEKNPDQPKLNREKEKVPEQINLEKEKLPELIHRQKEKISEQISRQKEKVPDKISREKEKVPEHINREKEKLPELINRQKEKVPEQINRQKEKVPEKISREREKVPEQINREKEKLTELINRQKEKLPEQINRRKEKVPEKIIREKEKVPEQINREKEKVPELINRQNEKLPEQINRQKEKVPEKISREKEKVPEQINCEKEKVPEQINREKEKVPEQINREKEKVPEQINREKEKVPEQIEEEPHSKDNTQVNDSIQPEENTDESEIYKNPFNEIMSKLPFARVAEKNNFGLFTKRCQPDIELDKLLCKKCDTKFTKIMELYEHMAEHYKWLRYSCKLCNYKHYKFDRLPEHVKIVHKLKGDADFYYSTVKAIDGTEALQLSEFPKDTNDSGETSPDSKRPSRCSSDSSRLSDDSSSSTTRVEGTRKRKMKHNKITSKKKKGVNDDVDALKDNEASNDMLDESDSASNVKLFEENSSDIDEVDEKSSKRRHDISTSSVFIPRRPIRKRTNKKNEDFEYDLSNLLKMEAQGYRDSQTGVPPKPIPTKKKSPENQNNIYRHDKEYSGALIMLSKRAVATSTAHLRCIGIYSQSDVRGPNIFLRPLLPKVARVEKASPKKDAQVTDILSVNAKDVKEVTNTFQEKLKPIEDKKSSNKDVVKNIEEKSPIEQKKSANDVGESSVTKISVPTVVPLKLRRQSIDLMKNPLIKKNITDFSKAGMKTKILVIKPINRNNQQDGGKTINTPLKFQTIKLKDPNKNSSEVKLSDQVRVVQVPKVDCTIALPASSTCIKNDTNITTARTVKLDSITSCDGKTPENECETINLLENILEDPMIPDVISLSEMDQDEISSIDDDIEIDEESLLNEENSL